LTDLPQFIVRDGQDAVPKAGIVLPLLPIRPEVPLKQQIDRRRYPRRNVDSVRHCPHGVYGIAEDRHKHPAGHLAMRLAHSVHCSGSTKSENGHVEEWPFAVVICCEFDQRITPAATRSQKITEVALDQIK